MSRLTDFFPAPTGFETPIVVTSEGMQEGLIGLSYDITPTIDIAMSAEASSTTVTIDATASSDWVSDYGFYPNTPTSQPLILYPDGTWAGGYVATSLHINCYDAPLNGSGRGTNRYTVKINDQLVTTSAGVLMPATIPLNLDGTDIVKIEFAYVSGSAGPGITTTNCWLDFFEIRSKVRVPGTPTINAGQVVRRQDQNLNYTYIGQRTNSMADFIVSGEGSVDTVEKVTIFFDTPEAGDIHVLQVNGDLYEYTTIGTETAADLARWFGLRLCSSNHRDYHTCEIDDDLLIIKGKGISGENGVTINGETVSRTTINASYTILKTLNQYVIDSTTLDPVFSTPAGASYTFVPVADLNAISPGWSNETGWGLQSNNNSVNSSNAEIEFTATWSSDGALLFDYVFNIESYFYDMFHVYVDDAPAWTNNGAISLVQDWTTLTIPISAGEHTIKFVYSKDGSYHEGADNVTIQNLRMVTSDPTPRFTYEAADTARRKILQNMTLNTYRESMDTRTLTTSSGGREIVNPESGNMKYVPIDRAVTLELPPIPKVNEAYPYTIFCWSNSGPNVMTLTAPTGHTLEWWTSDGLQPAHPTGGQRVMYNFIGIDDGSTKKWIGLGMIEDESP